MAKIHSKVTSPIIIADPEHCHNTCTHLNRHAHYCGQFKTLLEGDELRRKAGKRSYLLRCDTCCINEVKLTSEQQKEQALRCMKGGAKEAIKIVQKVGRN